MGGAGCIFELLKVVLGDNVALTGEIKSTRSTAASVVVCSLAQGGDRGR